MKMVRWMLGLAALMGCLPAAGQAVMLVDNPRVSMTVDQRSGQWQILDRQTGITWRSNPEHARFAQARVVVDGKAQTVELKPAEIRGSTLVFRPIDGSERTIRVTVKALADEAGVSFSYDADREMGVEWIRLLDDALAVTRAQKGQVLVPVRMGLLIPTDSGKAFTHGFETSGYEGCHMDMLGVVREGSTVLLSWDDPYVRAEVRSAVPAGGAQRLSVSLVLRKSAKAFELRLPGAGDHVTVARAYRQLVEKQGRLMTMRQKIAQNAERARLLGASNVKLWSALTRRMNEASTQEESHRVNWTFSEAAQVAEHLKNDLRLDRVLFTIGGWTHRGYDNQHPDILPAAPECGGSPALADAARRVMGLGYLFCLHDNYQDMYRDSPSWDEGYLMRRADGKIAVGGRWAGGRAYLTCSKQALVLAKRNQNLPAVAALTHANAYFIDTTYAADLQECSAPAHPLTRADDMKWKQALSDYARQTFGVFGSEDGREWAIAHADFFEGITGVSGRDFHNEKLEESLGAQSVPLFELVYHDCIQAYGKYGYNPAQAADYVLHHILIGRPLNYHSIPAHLYWKSGMGNVDIEPSIDKFQMLDRRRFAITYAWDVGSAPGEDCQALVHFTDASGKIIFQGDFAPRPGTSKWVKGRLLQGPFTVRVPEDAGGIYDIRVGLYQRPMGQRLALHGHEDRENRIIVGRLRVQGQRLQLLPVERRNAAADPAIFVRGDGGWTEGMHPMDRFLKNTHEVLSPLNELTSLLPMTSHRFLTPDGQVQQTVFGDGAATVTVNFGPGESVVNSKRFGDVKLPPDGFLVDSSTFVAFCAMRFDGYTYPEPAMFTLRSSDGKPIEQAARVRVYHAFGPADLRLRGKAMIVRRQASE